MTVYERYLEEKKKPNMKSVYDRYREAKGIPDVDVTGRYNTWLDNHNRFINNYNYRYSDNDGYRSDTSQWLSQITSQNNNFKIEADYIKSQLYRYDKDTADNIAKSLDSALKTQADIISASTKDDEYWSQWQDERDYNSYLKAYEIYKNRLKDLETAKNKLNLPEEQQAAKTRYDNASTAFTKAQSDYDSALRKIQGRERQASLEKDTMDQMRQANENLKSAKAEYDLAKSAWDEYGIDYDTLQNEYIKLYSELSDENYFTKTKAEEWAKADAAYDVLSQYNKGYLSDVTYQRVNYENLENKGVGMRAQEGDPLFRVMKDEEKATYNYLYAAKGKEAADEYLGYINTRSRTREWQQSIAEQLGSGNFGEKVLGSALSVITKPAESYAYVRQALDYAFKKEVDPNAEYNDIVAFNSKIRNTISSNMGEFGSFMYQTGMSMADFLYNMLLTAPVAGLGGAGTTAAKVTSKIAEGLTLGIMGSEAAAETVMSAKARGLSDKQSFVLGTIAGAAEIVTEVFSVEKLLDMKLLGRNKLKYFLQNTLTEGSEEVGSDIINLFADIIIAKDNSEWKQRVQEYKDQGIPDSQAFWRSVLDVIGDMSLSFAGGALSGGVMAGGQIALNYNTDTKIGKSVEDRVDDVLAAGKKLDENSDAYKLASEITERKNAGEEISTAEIGELFREETSEAFAEGMKKAKEEEEAEAAKMNIPIDEAIKNAKFEGTEAEIVKDLYDPQSKMSTVGYTRGMLEAYKMGQVNYDKNNVDSRGYAADLTKKQFDTAYKMGQMAAKAINDGSVKILDGTDVSKLSEAQQTQYKVVKRVADVLGIKVNLFASVKGKNGQQIGANGWITKDGDIYIDINSGSDGRGVMLFTMAHELTHAIERDAASYAKLKNFLLKNYSAKGMTEAQLVAAKKAALGTEAKGKSYDDILREVIADSCEAMLTDPKVLDKIAELKKTDRSLWQKIKSFIAEIAAKLKHLMTSGYFRSETAEGRYVREMADAIDELQQIWAEGVVAATSKSTTSGETTTETETNSEKVETETENDSYIIDLGYDFEPQYQAKSEKPIEKSENESEAGAATAEPTQQAEKPSKKNKKTVAEPSEIAPADEAVEAEEKKIEDFGEKIGGARKDLWSKNGMTAEEWRDLNKVERGKYVKKDYVWGKADYKSYIEAGMPRDIAYFVKTIRDAIPVSPERIKANENNIDEQQQKYIEEVQTIKSALEKLRSYEDCKSFGTNYLKENGYRNTTPGLSGYSDKYFHSAIMTTKLIYALQKTDGYYWKQMVRKMNDAKFMMTAEEKANALPKGVTIEYCNVESKTMHADTYYVTKGHYIVQSNFQTREDALNWVKENITSPESTRKGKFVPPQLEAIHRTGYDVRSKENINGEDYLNDFGFRGGEFGNWLNQNDRQTSLNYGYDAFSDLANVLGIKLNDVSFGGKLAIAFGARGRAGAAAHYEQDRQVINLTKMHGAGSLAHEWWHALDNIFAEEYDENSEAFMTKKRNAPEAIKQLVEKMRAKKAEDGRIIKTDFLVGSETFDREYSKADKGYWSSTIEMAARAFSCYIHDKLTAQDLVNDYLAGHSEGYVMLSDGKPVYAMPKGAERVAINKAFDNVFAWLKENNYLTNRAVKPKGANVMRYSVREQYNSPENETQQTVFPEVNAKYMELAKDPVKNEAALQKMVDEAAKAAMPNSKVKYKSGKLRPVYHYTNARFTEFKPMPASEKSSRTLGDGYYVSTDESEYAEFGEYKLKLFANIANPFERDLSEEQAQAVYDKYFRQYHEDKFHTYEPHVVSALQTSYKVFDYLKEAAEKNGTTTSEILTELGYDGVRDGSIWVAFDSNQLKSASPVVYDGGKIIPLSKRFNPENNDIRYSARQKNGSSDVGTKENPIELSNNTELNSLVKNIYGAKRYSIIAQYIHKALSEEGLILSDGKRITVDNSDAKHLAHYALDKKTSELAKVKEIAKSAVLIAEEKANHSKFSQFYYYETFVKFENDIFPIYLNVGETINKANEFHLYDITQKLRESARRVYGVERADANAADALLNRLSEKTILQSDGIVNTSDKKYSSRTDTAVSMAYAALSKELVEQNEELIKTVEAVNETWKKIYDENGNIPTSAEMNAAARTILKKAHVNPFDKTAVSAAASKVNAFFDGLQNADVPSAVASAQSLAESLIKSTDTVTYNKKVNDLVADILNVALDTMTLRRSDRTIVTMKAKEQAEKLIEEYRTNQAATQLKSKTRGQIYKLADKAHKMIDHQQKGKFIPGDLLPATKELLTAINFDTGRAGKTNLERLAKIKALYDEYNKTGKGEATSEYDEFVSNMLEQLSITVGNTPVYKMTQAQLNEVKDALTAMLKRIDDADKLYFKDRIESAHEASLKMIEETKEAKGGKNFAERGNNKIANKIISAADWIDFLMERPKTAFIEFGGGNPDGEWANSYDDINQGQTEMTQYQMDASRLFRDIINKKTRKQVEALKDKQIDTKLKDNKGEKIIVPKAFAISLYLSALNNDSARHTAMGGFAVPFFEAYYKNDKNAYATDRKFDGYGKEFMKDADAINDMQAELNKATANNDEEKMQQLSADLERMRANLADRVAERVKQFRELTETLWDEFTEWDKKLIVAIQQYYNEFAPERLNEVTQTLYGFDKANVENYFPIWVDKNFLGANYDAKNGDYRIANMGSMKERVVSSQPIVLADVLDVLAKSINFDSRYVGLAIPLDNFSKRYGYSTGGKDNTSVKAVVEAKFGKAGTEYIDRLLKNMNGQNEKDSGAKFRSLLAKSSLMLNVRVMLSQAASFPTAAAVVGYKPLMKALAMGGQNGWIFSKADREAIEEISPLLWSRLQGESTIELGDAAHTQNMFRNNRWKWATGWIQAMDAATVGRLFYAAKFYVEDTLGIKEGDKNYKAKLKETYERIIQDTQPNYSAMQRPDILRRGGAIRFLTMFKTQLFQNYNIAREAVMVYNYRRKQAAKLGTEEARAKLKEARASLTRAVSSQLASAATIAGIKFVVDALMAGLRGYRDDDEMLTEKSITAGMLDNMFNSLASSVIGGDMVYNAIKSIIEKSPYYGVDVGILDNINDAAEKLIDVTKLIGSEKATVEKVTKTIYYAAEAVATAFGIPVRNAKKIVDAILRPIYEYAAEKKSFLESHIDRTPSQWTNILFDSMLTGNDTWEEKARLELTKHYTESGKTVAEAESLINNAMIRELRDSDERFEEAKKAYENYDYATYNELCDELKADYPMFPADDIYKAARSTAKRETGDEEEQKTKAYRQYTYDDAAYALFTGEENGAKEQLKTDERYAANLKASFKRLYKDEYREATKDEKNKIKERLWKSGIFKKYSDMTEWLNNL